MGSRERLAGMYETHHRTGRRAGFTFGGSAKGILMARWIGTGHRVLDLGCRDGTLAAYYAPGNTVVGVDVDREALAACERGLGIETRWHDVTEGLPFQDGAFDVVVASELLEHLSFPEELVADAARVLRPGGLFVGSVPNAFRLKSRLLFLIGREPDPDPTHLRRFSVTGLRSLLRTRFGALQITPTFGRLAWLHGPWFANTLLWRCRKP